MLLRYIKRCPEHHRAVIGSRKTILISSVDNSSNSYEIETPETTALKRGFIGIVTIFQYCLRLPYLDLHLGLALLYVLFEVESKKGTAFSRCLLLSHRKG
jgi:hypothetical protein